MVFNPTPCLLSGRDSVWPNQTIQINMKKILTIALLVFSLSALAQEKIAVTEADYSNNSVEMADRMRAEGKIYVLVGIIAIIFAGITVYVINTDRRISKLEKNLPS
jgi:CcmD family protein